MTTTSPDRATVRPVEEGVEEMSRFREFLAAAPEGHHPGRARLVAADGTEHVVPEEVFEVLRVAAEAMSLGKAVSIIPTDLQLTTQEAAEYVGVSRPTLVKLLEEGRIPFTRPGRHRRILLKDLQAYEEQMRRERRQALREISREALADGSYHRSLSNG